MFGACDDRGTSYTWRKKKEREMNEKYAVFKREDVQEAFKAELGKPLEQTTVSTIYAKLTGAELEDAVVIRRQDIFAPPALEMYSSSILTAIQLAKADLQEGDELPIQIKKLEEIAGYFQEQAELAYTTDRKIPD